MIYTRWLYMALGIALAATIAAGATPQVRALVLKSDDLVDAAHTEGLMKRAREAGLNTVYVEVFPSGLTQFPSATLRRTLSIDRDPILAPKTGADPRNLLLEALLEAHRQGLICIASFSLAIDRKSGEARQFPPQWTCGSPTQPDDVLDLLQPDAAEFLRGIVLDAVKPHDLDGVQIDFRIPASACDDGTARDLYAKEHDGKQPQAEDPAWRSWRAAKLTTSAATLVAAIRNERPGLIVSAVVSPYPQSTRSDLADWTEWIKDTNRLTWTEFAIAAPCPAPADSSWRVQLEHAGQHADHLIAVPLFKSGIKWPDVRDCLEWTQAEQNSPDPEPHHGARSDAAIPLSLLTSYAKELEEYYHNQGAGTPPHPYFAARTPGEWRPVAVAAIPTGKKAPRDTEKWNIPSLLPAEYDVIAKENGIRKIVMHLNLVKSRPTLAVPTKYSEPELLLDRRPDMAAEK